MAIGRRQVISESRLNLRPVPRLKILAQGSLHRYPARTVDSKVSRLIGDPGRRISRFFVAASIAKYVSSDYLCNRGRVPAKKKSTCKRTKYKCRYVSRWYDCLQLFFLNFVRMGLQQEDK
jgi:hypothetical protein